MKLHTLIAFWASTLFAACSSQHSQATQPILSAQRPPQTITTTPITTPPQPSPPTTPVAPTITSVAGRTYVGPPTGDVSRSGCEGCGEPGTFEFQNNGTVQIVAPGDDIINDGSYTQQGTRIEIHPRFGSRPIVLTLVDGGRALLEPTTHTRFRVVNP